MIMEQRTSAGAVFGLIGTTRLSTFTRISGVLCFPLAYLSVIFYSISIFFQASFVLYRTMPSSIPPV